MNKLQDELEQILKRIPKENFNNMIKYIENHYTKVGCVVNEEFLKEFFETNFSTGIWYDSLHNSILESVYHSIIELEDSDWEKADFIGSRIGEYVIKHILN